MSTATEGGQPARPGCVGVLALFWGGGWRAGEPAPGPQPQVRKLSRQSQPTGSQAVGRRSEIGKGYRVWFRHWDRSTGQADSRHADGDRAGLQGAGQVSGGQAESPQARVTVYGFLLASLEGSVHPQCPRAGQLTRSGPAKQGLLHAFSSKKGNMLVLFGHPVSRWKVIRIYY